MPTFFSRLKYPPHRIALIGVMLFFVCAATWYSTQIPLGEGPDEPGHAEFAFFVARENRLPNLMAGEVVGEAHQPPLAYWLLQPMARSIEFDQRRVFLGSNPRWIWAGGSEAAAFAWRSVDRLPYRGDVAAWHAMRLMSVLWGALTLLLTYGIARRIGLSEWTSVVAVAMLAILPQFIFHAALVSNDPLLWTLCALCVWIMLDSVPSRWWSWQIGSVLGLALLTKQSALLLVPIIAVILWLRRREIPAIRTSMSIAVSVIVLTGWWYVRNVRLYGDLFGLAQYKGEFASPTFSPFVVADWGAAWRALSTSLVANFGWMSVVAPDWVYMLAGMTVLIAVVGLIMSHSIMQRRFMMILAVWLISTLAWTFAFAIISGQVGWQGRFILPAAPVLAIALALGLTRLLRRFALAVPLIWVVVVLLLPSVMIAPAYPRWVVAPQPERPLLGTWKSSAASPIELRGLRLPPVMHRGKVNEIGTLWRTLGIQERNWALFVHLAPPNTKDEVFSVDVQPQDGKWNAKRWTPNDWWEDVTFLQVPADLPLGEYDVRLGWFDEQGEWERIGAWNGDQLIGDYVTVGRIRVEE